MSSAYRDLSSTVLTARRVVVGLGRLVLGCLVTVLLLSSIGAPNHTYFCSSSRL